jgi:predicted GIY-YIG superfamily endonuclease
MQKPAFHYVYILQSKIDADRFYIGFTENIENRLKDHNSGIKIPTQQNTNRGVSRQPLRLQTEKKLWISKDI